MNEAPKEVSIPWDLWFEIAFGRIHIKPKEFWGLSLKEWRIILTIVSKPTGMAGQEPVDGIELQTLMQKFPDHLNK